MRINNHPFQTPRNAATLNVHLRRGAKHESLHTKTLYAKPWYLRTLVVGVDQHVRDSHAPMDRIFDLFGGQNWREFLDERYAGNGHGRELSRIHGMASK